MELPEHTSLAILIKGVRAAQAQVWLMLGTSLQGTKARDRELT